jgi:gliding motility-associated-like protein
MLEIIKGIKIKLFMMKKYFFYFAFIIFFLEVEVHAQIPTQQWLTVLNETSASNDLIQGGVSKFPLELNTIESKIVVVNNFANQPASTVLNTIDGSIVFSNSQPINAYGRDVVFEDNDSVASLSTGLWGASDAYISKYDLTGNFIFNNSVNNYRDDYAITLKKINNQFVFYTLNRATGTSILTHSIYCYNSAGIQQWTSEINDYDWFYGYEGRMTTDIGNNVIFSGKRQTSTSPNTYDVIIRKINSNGIQMWQSYFDQGNIMDHITGRSLITDSNGDVYFADANSNNWSGTSFRLVKLNGQDGSLMYNQLIGNTQVTDFNFASNGNLVVGTVNEVRSYDPSNGLMLWSQSYPNINSVKTDSQGNILVSTLNGLHILDNNGNLQYTLNVSISGYSTNHVFAITDSNGAIYIVGYRTSGSINKVFVAKYLNCGITPSVVVNNDNVCEGQTATLTASPSQQGGSYIWSSGESSQSINPSLSGTYTVSYTLVPGCMSATGSGSVVINPAPTVTVNNDTICEGENIILTAIPSIPSGNYSWSNGENTQSINPISTGQYTVSYSIGTGCTPGIASGTVLIIANPVVNLNNTLVCGLDSSEITLSYSALSNVNFLWNTGQTIQNITVNNSGEYFVSVTDTNGCFTNDSIYVSILNPTIIAGQTAICSGDSTTLSVSTAMNNSSILWSDGTINQTSIVPYPTQTTTYNVHISDGVSTCTDSLTILVNNIQINVGQDISVCSGDSAMLSATGSATYLWDNGVINGQTFVPTIEGYYNVIGTDTLGCSKSDSIYLDLLQPTSSSISPVNCTSYIAPDGIVYTNSGQYSAIIPNVAGCDSIISINLTINNISSGIDTKVTCDSYTWIDGNTYSSSNNSATFVLQNANGCDSTITLNLTINKLVDLNAGNDIKACEGENITLTATGANSYNWTNGVSNGVPFISQVGTTIYTVNGTDNNGCTATDEVTVIIDYCLEIPGGISPNGDNANDTWTIKGLSQYPNSKVYIFDRWGQKIFSGDASSPTWDGTVEGKVLPTADYYYIIELGNGENLNGVVTLKK